MVPAPTGREQVKGLQAQVEVSRDSLGIPLIEAQNEEDLAFAMGYVAAEDRLSQMIGLKLTAAGRLAEMSGKSMLDIDFYMRCVDLNKVAQLLYEASSPETKRTLQRYAEGINAYVANHKLPPDLQLAGYSPDPWQPQDSVKVFALINLGLALNAREELVYLQLAQKLGAERAVWLIPIYPDEALPFSEAKKLAGVDLSGNRDILEQLSALELRLAVLVKRPFAASNNWAVQGSRTAKGVSILANDTHLPLSMPSVWHYVHAKAPGYDAAGVAIAGAPGAVLDFNGRLAWGATMVMSDNQDIFLEELMTIAGKLYYRKGSDWLPATERVERFQVKGDKPVTRTFYETRHGPLLNSALSSTFGPEVTPTPVKSRYGLALSWSALEADRTLDGVLGVAHAQSVAEATPIMQDVRAIALNYVYADRDHIAWQVTGRYPLRNNGRGKLPSPGWVEDYDWTGYLPVAKHPTQLDPPEGFVSTANQRIVPADFPYVLSSSLVLSGAGGADRRAVEPRWRAYPEGDAKHAIRSAQPDREQATSGVAAPADGGRHQQAIG